MYNLAGFGLLGAVYLQHWLDGTLRGHTGWLSLGIFLVFLYGLGLCAARVWRLSRDLEAIREQTIVRIENPFSRRSWDYLGDLNLRIVPPPVPPMKRPPVPAQIFNPREQSI